MQETESKTTVTYLSGKSDSLGAGWDVLQVKAESEDGDKNFFTIAKDAAGKIIRRTDVLLDRWEVISEVEDLRFLRHCFSERDRLTAEKASEDGIHN